MIFGGKADAVCHAEDDYNSAASTPTLKKKPRTDESAGFKINQGENK